MSGNFNITFSGVNELLTQFKVAGDAAQKLTENTMRTTIGKAQAKSKALAPVRTGFMQNNIEVAITESNPDRVVGQINAKADYSSFNEFGTYKMAARPFISPSVKAVTPWFFSAMKKALEGAVK